VQRFDTVVVGLGATGSAALYHLAKQGRRVLGLDRHAPPHVYGSTHGDTRITRLAIGEGAHYTPLALRSHELWRELERESGERLLTTHGGLVISSAARSSSVHVENFFANTVAAAREYGIAHELLDAREIRRRFPPLIYADDEVGYLEREAGFLRPEACVRAHLALAARRGAELHTNEEVAAFEASPDGVTVTTGRATYAADTVILAAGPWLPELLGPRLARCFAVYRQVLLWFAIEGPIEPFLPERFPVFIWEVQARTQGIYGFPALDGAAGGVKVATESFARATTPGEVDRGVRAEEIAATWATHVAPFIAGLGAVCVKAATCLYTTTPDFGFVVDRHPESERIVVASPCSGHGFKHSPAIGEALAALVTGDAPRFSLADFRFGRFGGLAVSG
jgi:sarcosine oxidase